MRLWDKGPGRSDGVRKDGDVGVVDVVGVGKSLVAVRVARARFFFFMLEIGPCAFVRSMALV